VTVPLELEAGATRDIRLILPRGGALEGTVYQRGEPQEGQELEVLLLEGMRQLKAKRTDGGGRYRFENVEPGKVMVTVRRRSPSDGVDESTPATGVEHIIAHTATIEDGRSTVVDFHFTSGTATVHGQVTLNGHPQAGATVMLSVPTVPADEFRQVKTDPEGRFKFEAVPAGKVALLANDRELTGGRRLDLEVEDGDEVKTDIELASGLSFQLNVSGLQEGEEAAAYIFRGDIKIDRQDLTGSIQKNVPHIAAMKKLKENGLTPLGGLAGGRYTVLAVCVRTDIEPAEMIERARVCTFTFEVGKNTSEQIELRFE
jgi:hypothetical protein